MNPDVHTLTGAYALDALTETERVEFERHLRECPDCVREVHEFQETAARFAAAAAVLPPEELRERVLTEIARTRQLSPNETAQPGASASRRRWPLRAAALVTAAAVIAAVVLGVELAGKNGELDGTQRQLASISSVLRAPDAAASKGSAADGGSAMAIVSPSEHRAVLMVSGMPRVPDDRVYQLWFMGRDGAHPAGLLHRDTEGRLAPVVTDTVPGASQVGLTVEPAGGSPQPTNVPLMGFRLA